MTEQELVTLTIEGTEVSVPKGFSVLQAAEQIGITIPRYCYHPGLPVAGVCRMCLVEIEGMPNLQVSCATTAMDGQKVSVFSEKAKKARQGVLEFLLINHPLDCPICDQAGECKLQDFVFEGARADSRYSPTYAKRFDPVEDFGGDIIYVPNRCIMCTRCVRFMDHMAHDRIIAVQERGDRAYIGVHPDVALDHPWAGNVVDLCPVGSLLSKEFLHKARAWELDKTPSICDGCSQGCNTYIETLGNRVQRIRARENADVNKFFMCDVGRAGYKQLNREDRLKTPFVFEDGNLKQTDWESALTHAATIVSGSGGRVVALASPHVSTEALFYLKGVFAGANFHGAFRADTVDGEEPLLGVNNLALRSERAPNATGAKILGYSSDFQGALDAIAGAALLVVLGESLEGVTADVINGAAHTIYLGQSLPGNAKGVNVVLPITNFAEEDGTFVNRDSRVQRYSAASVGPGQARPAWQALSLLAAKVDRGEEVNTAQDAFAKMAQKESKFSGMSYDTIGDSGAVASAGQATGGSE